MITSFFKKNTLFAAALLFFVALNADHKKTNKIQVLIDPSANSFFFNGFNGTSIYNNVFGPRVAGGYYYLNGMIYPEGTIDHNSTCFSTSKPSLGQFICVANLIANLSFDQNFPVETYVEDVRWNFYFDKDCDNEANNIIAFGKVFSGNFTPNAIGFHGAGMPVIGSKCNKELNSIKLANAYFNNFISCSSGPQILIEIEFEDKIEYKK